MTMLKGIALSVFLAGCLAVYLAVLILTDPTLPGGSTLPDTRVAYSMTIMALAVICCVVAGLTWSRASTVQADTAVTAAFGLIVLFLIAIFFHLSMMDRLLL